MTGYVATRWYRAPEIMLNWMHYNQTGLCLTCSLHICALIIELFQTFHFQDLNSKFSLLSAIQLL